MNPNLRDRITRKLESLPDDRGYQILDYVEFLESKYAERQAPPANVFTRFAEGVEDAMRAGRLSTQTITQTMDLMNKAMGVLNGVTAAGSSLANDLVSTASEIATNPLQKPPASGGQGTMPTSSLPPNAPPAPATAAPNEPKAPDTPPPPTKP
ncbi:MAG: hypothetical protein FJ363_05725 [Gemmatimonadetes bacterium]|nr:hypothetical protein [Gemmatimonadota bacterium]